MSTILSDVHSGEEVPDPGSTILFSIPGRRVLSSGRGGSFWEVPGRGVPGISAYHLYLGIIPFFCSVRSGDASTIPAPPFPIPGISDLTLILFWRCDGFLRWVAPPACHCRLRCTGVLSGFLGTVPFWVPTCSHLPRFILPPGVSAFWVECYLWVWDFLGTSGVEVFLMPFWVQSDYSHIVHLPPLFWVEWKGGGMGGLMPQIHSHLGDGPGGCSATWVGFLHLPAWATTVLGWVPLQCHPHLRSFCSWSTTYHSTIPPISLLHRVPMGNFYLAFYDLRYGRCLPRPLCHSLLHLPLLPGGSCLFWRCLPATCTWVQVGPLGLEPTFAWNFEFLGATCTCIHHHI